MWVPEKAVVDGKIWICDPRTKRVEVRTATSTTETREGYRRLSSGIKPGEWVVVTPQDLRSGQRVNPNLIQP